jgi:hypothetical protein
MTLANTAEYARQCFEKAYPDKTKRGMIIVDFMREELEMTPVRIKELTQEGRTTTPDSLLKEDYSTRLFLWIYINHLSTTKYDQPGN